MTDLSGKKLGILISSHPDRGDFAHVEALTRASIEQGVDVYLYLIDEGTRHYLNPNLKMLGKSGVKLFVCAYGGKPRGVEPDADAVFGGLAALGGIIDGCDRFVSFN